MFHGFPPLAAVLCATMEARIVTFEAGDATVMPPPVQPAWLRVTVRWESVTFAPDG